MAGRKRFTRAVRRGPKNQVWAALVLSNIVVDDNPVITANLVEDGDWTTVGGLERATILRVRGWLTASPPVALPSTLFLAIAPQDTQAGVAGLDPTAAATYGLEDIVWTDGVSVAVTAAANDLVSPKLIVDIKSMRKISSGIQLRIAMKTNGPVGAGWTVSGVFRTLVRLGGN